MVSKYKGRLLHLPFFFILPNADQNNGSGFTCSHFLLKITTPSKSDYRAVFSGVVFCAVSFTMKRLSSIVGRSGSFAGYGTACRAWSGSHRTEYSCKIRSSLQDTEQSALHGMSLHDRKRLAGHRAGRTARNIPAR